MYKTIRVRLVESDGDEEDCCFLATTEVLTEERQAALKVIASQWYDPDVPNEAFQCFNGLYDVSEVREVLQEMDRNFEKKFPNYAEEFAVVDKSAYNVLFELLEIIEAESIGKNASIEYTELVLTA